MKPAIFVLIAGLLPLAAMAQTQISTEYVYIHATNPKSAAAYMLIRNDSAQTCTLMGVSTPAAARAELHRTRDEGGVMRMISPGPVVLGPDESLVLAPGWDHLMLMGLTAPLKDGDQVELVLDMGDCGLVQVLAPVDNAR